MLASAVTGVLFRFFSNKPFGDTWCAAFRELESLLVFIPVAATIVLVTVVTPWMCCTMTTTTILTVARADFHVDAATSEVVGISRSPTHCIKDVFLRFRASGVLDFLKMVWEKTRWAAGWLGWVGSTRPE